MICRNGQMELVLTDTSAAEERLFRGFCKNNDWHEAIVSYIRLYGDTELDDLTNHLSYILKVNPELACIHIGSAISKLKILGSIKAINVSIQAGDNKLCLSERSMDDVLMAVSRIRRYGSFSEAYYESLILDIQTGRDTDPRIPISAMDVKIAEQTLKMLLAKGYLTKRGKAVYSTQKLNAWAELRNS